MQLGLVDIPEKSVTAARLKGSKEWDLLKYKCEMVP